MPLDVVQPQPQPGVEDLFDVPQGQDLPADTLGDDRTDSALVARERSYQQADALRELMDGAEQAQPEEQSEAAEEERTPLGVAGAVAMDIGKGAVEAPRQVVGGIRDAVEAIVQLGGDFFDEKLPLGGAQIFDKEWNFDPQYFTAAEFAAEKAAGRGADSLLPEVGAPSTVTGAVVQGASQFLVPFGKVAKMLGGLRGATKAGTVGKTLAAGAVTDFLAFQGDEGRLADLLPTVPVVEFLQSKEGDTDIEGRTKNAIEGIGLGGIASTVFKALKVLRATRSIAKGENAEERLADVFRFAGEERVLQSAGEMSLLGTASEKAPLIVKKAKAAVTETATGVPDDVAARALTARGLTPLDGKGDVFINFAKVSTPEDIQRLIKDTSTAFKPDIEAARRGVRTNAATLLSAADVNAWDTLMTRRVGQPLNAEQSVAARSLWATAAQKLGQVANIASATPSPENLFQFRRMLATFHAIQKEVIGARTETARALQSWAIPVGANLEKMRDMTDALTRSGGLSESADLARRFAAAANLQSGGVTVMSKMAERTFFQKALGSVQEYWINALLSGPKTHIVNMMSNAAVAGLSVVERGAAARFGQLFSDEAGVEIGEALAMTDGVRGGIIDAFRNAGKSLVTGQQGFGLNKIEMPRERYLSSGSWNVRSESWLGRGIDALGAVVNIPGKMLQAEDEFFKTIGYRMEIHAQATRMVRREIREGKLDPKAAAGRRAQILDDPPEAIRMEAVSHAAYQTFTSDPGKFTRGFQRVISAVPALKFIMPFVNTPANILKYTFERTPLAPLSSKYRAAVAEGGAAGDLARTKMALGTAALLYAIDLGLQGHTTGSGPTDSMAEMQNWRRQGNQPYALKVGDKQFAFNRLDPMGYHLGIGADIAEYLINAQPDGETFEEVQEGISATVFSVVENINSKAYLEGLSMLMEAVSDPQRFASTYVERFASSFIPAGAAEIARLIDPAQRQAHDIVTAMKRRLPGFSSDLPPRRDLWGREVRYESGMGKVYDTLSPIYGSNYRPEPIDQAMQADGWFVGMGQNFFKIDGETVSMRNRPDIHSRFLQLRGGTKPSEIEAEGLLDKYGDATLLETLNAVVTGQSDLSPIFQEQDTSEDREKFVEGIVRDYSNAAKKKLFMEYPELIDMAARKKATRN